MMESYYHSNKGGGGRGKKGGGGRSTDWSRNDWDSGNWDRNWDSGSRSWSGSGKGGLKGAVSSLVQLEEARAWREHDKEVAAAKLAEEEKARVEKEKEVEERKREREALMEEVREQHREQMKALKDARAKGSSPSPRGGRNRSRSPKSGSSDYLKDLKASRAAARQQRAVAPIDVEDWKEWECSTAEFHKLRHHFPTLVLQECKSEGIAEIGEYINGLPAAEVGNKTEVRRMHKDIIGSEAPARWARLDIIVAIIAHVVKN